MDHICETCKFGCLTAYGYDITMTDDECGGCAGSNDKWQPKDD